MFLVFYSSLLLQAVLKRLKWSFLSEILRHLPVYFWNCNKIKFLPSISSLQNLLYTHLCSSKCMYSFLVNCYYTYVHADVYICIFTSISKYYLKSIYCDFVFKIYHVTLKNQSRRTASILGFTQFPVVLYGEFRPSGFFSLPFHMFGFVHLIKLIFDHSYFYECMSIYSDVSSKHNLTETSLIL